MNQEPTRDMRRIGACIQAMPDVKSTRNRREYVPAATCDECDALVTTRGVRSCPNCGGRLTLAHVVRCQCGLDVLESDLNEHEMNCGG